MELMGCVMVRHSYRSELKMMYAVGGRGGCRGSRSCFRFRFRAGSSTSTMVGAVAAGTLLQSWVRFEVRFPQATAAGRRPEDRQ